MKWIKCWGYDFEDDQEFDRLKKIPDDKVPEKKEEPITDEEKEKMEFKKTEEMIGKKIAAENKDIVGIKLSPALDGEIAAFVDNLDSFARQAKAVLLHGKYNKPYLESLDGISDDLVSLAGDLLVLSDDIAEEINRE